MKSNRKLSKRTLERINTIIECLEHVSNESRNTWLITKSREAQCVMYRYIFVYMCVMKLKIPKSVMGAFVDLDHTTILHGIKNVEYWLDLPDVYEYQSEVFNEVQLEYASAMDQNEYIDAKGYKWTRHDKGK